MASRTTSAAADIAAHAVANDRAEYETLMLVPGKLTLPAAAAEMFKDTHWVAVAVVVEPAVTA